VGGMAQPQHQQQLRPGWYPDPDGAMCYRKYDGRDWSDETRDVPAASRAKFRQQQQALQRRMGIAPAKAQRGGHLSQVHGRQAAVDPGRGLAIAAFVTSIVSSVLLIPLILARMSRTRSNAVGLPRSGFALAALIITWLQLALFGVAIVMAIVIPTMLATNKMDPQHTKAKAAVKEASTAIESCAANRIDGAYGPCLGGRAAPVPACRPARPASGTTCADPIGRYGYVIRSTSEDGTLFVKRQGQDGTVAKTCAPNGGECRSGRWS
jgi:hypothetical protein